MLPESVGWDIRAFWIYRAVAGAPSQLKS